MRLLAVDPGPERSALLVYDVERGCPVAWRKLENRVVVEEIVCSEADGLAVEMVASYGMPVGVEVFETCVWIGRMEEAWISSRSRPGSSPVRVFRRDVKLHLCGSARAGDPNVRQALIDRYGPGRLRAVGRKACPGPLYGMSGDCWAALGVAVTAVEALDWPMLAAGGSRSDAFSGVEG